MDLTHHFLLSMPALADSWFDKSITYIFEHSDSGAVGFVVNRHTQLVAGDIYDQLKIDCDDAGRRSIPVFQGGPVDGERGFILCDSSTLPDAVNDDSAADGHYNTNDFGIGISSSLDRLEELGRGQGPDSHLLLVGYAGWAAGQLESEIAGNSWLTCEASSDIIFHDECDAKFNLAAKSLGIDFTLLSGDAGHA